MSSDMYMHLVEEMHKKFGQHTNQLPACQFEEKEFRAVCLQEELNEFIEAENNSEDELDALVDMAVFLFGTIHRLGYGFVFPEAYRRVMAANMQKEVGPNTKRGSYSLDLRKPEGWHPPYLKDLV